MPSSGHGSTPHAATEDSAACHACALARRLHLRRADMGPGRSAGHRCGRSRATRATILFPLNRCTQTRARAPVLAGVVLCLVALAALACAWRLRRRPKLPEEHLISDASRRISALKARHAAQRIELRSIDASSCASASPPASRMVPLDATCDPLMLDDLLPVTVNLMVAHSPSLENAEELGTMSTGRELHMCTAASDDVHSLHTAMAAAAKRWSAASNEISPAAERLAGYEEPPPGSQNSALEVQVRAAAASAGVPLA